MSKGYKELKDWVVNVDYPEFADDGYILTITGGYLLKDGDLYETPRMAYRRVAKAAASTKQGKLIAKDLKVNLEEEFFNLFWNGYLMPASPVLANTGTDRGLPASCYGGTIEDDMDDIISKLATIKKLMSVGGGVGVHMNLRPAGIPIKKGQKGEANSPVPYNAELDSNTNLFRQAGLKRGQEATFFSIYEKEIRSYINIPHESNGERFYKNIQTGVVIDDDFMVEMIKNDNKEYQELYELILEMRVKRGFPYIIYIDNMRSDMKDHWNLPPKANIRASNLCTEIALPVDIDNWFTCFLSSMNITKFDEWKDKNAVFYSVIFLDCIIEIFIEMTKDMPFMREVRNFAINTRSMGLGAQGFHTYLQNNNYPYEGVLTNSYYVPKIFGHMKEEGERASKYLGKLLGTSKWVKKESGYRNLVIFAIAPNKSSCKFYMNNSEGIMPIVSNYFTDITAKGTISNMPMATKKMLEEHNMYNDKVLKSIKQNEGSIMHLDLPDDVKEVFKTRIEINQANLIRTAAEIQKYIDQAISLNLTFTNHESPEFINQCHLLAWDLGLKSLYYLKKPSTSTSSQIDKLISSIECTACEG